MYIWCTKKRTSFWLLSNKLEGKRITSLNPFFSDCPGALPHRLRHFKNITTKSGALKSRVNTRLADINFYSSRLQWTLQPALCLRILSCVSWVFWVSDNFTPKSTPGSEFCRSSIFRLYREWKRFFLLLEEFLDFWKIHRLKISWGQVIFLILF